MKLPIKETQDYPESLPLVYFLLIVEKAQEIWKSEKPPQEVGDLTSWRLSQITPLTLNRHKLEHILKIVLKDPDYDLEQDLVDGDLIIPPNLPAYLKPYVTKEDYPIRLTKTKIILPSYAELDAYLRGRL